MAFNCSRDYGSTVIGEVTLDQAYGGARGIKSLVWEVSSEISEPLANDSANSFSRVPFSTPRRVSVSVATLYVSIGSDIVYCLLTVISRFPSAKSFCPRLPVVRSPCPRVSSGFC